MEKKDIKELIDLLEESGLKKIILKEKDFEIHLEKEDSFSMPPPAHHRAALPPATAPASTADATEEGGYYVESPMVGTFYPAPAPDQSDFVKVGDRVTEDTTVCIIEAMKVMNEVKAGKSGTVAEILLSASDPVEFGTKLFRIV